MLAKGYSADNMELSMELAEDGVVLASGIDDGCLGELGGSL